MFCYVKIEIFRVMLCVMISIFALEHGIFTVNIWKSAFKFIKKVTFRKVCTVYGPGKKFVLLYSLGGQV